VIPTAAIAFVALAVGLLVGVSVGRRSAPKLEAWKQLNVKATQLWDQHLRDQLKISAVEDYTDEVRVLRDRYKKIAATHDVKMPETTKKSEKVLWKDRRFALPFPRVLEKVKEFILSIDEDLILVEMDVQGKSTFWGPAIKDAGWTKGKDKTLIDTLNRSFSGPPAEVAEEIEAFFTSYRPFSDAQGRPKDPLLLVFQVKTPRYEDLPEPKVQIVEVAVVEEVIVERDVAVPVYIVVEVDGSASTQLEDPRTERKQLPGPVTPPDLEERVRAMIEVEVATVINGKRSE